MGKKATTKAASGPVFTGALLEDKAAPKAVKSFSSNVTRSTINRNPWLSALVNPFDSEAVQLPDEYAGGSIPLKLIEDIDMVVDANGYAMTAVAALLVTQLRSAATLDANGAVLTLSAFSDHPDYADCLVQFGSMRTLLYGIEVISTLSDNENQGRICAVTSTSASAYLAVASTVRSCFDDAANPLPLKEGLMVVLRPTQPPRFTATNDNSQGQHTLPATTIAITGAKPGSRVSLRIVKFMEALPTKNSLHRSSVTVEPYDLFTMSAAANMALHEPAVHPNTSAGHRAMKEEGESLAEDAVKFLASSLTSLGILPPGVASVGVAAYDAVKRSISKRKMRH